MYFYIKNIIINFFLFMKAFIAALISIKYNILIKKIEYYVSLKIKPDSSYEYFFFIGSVITFICSFILFLFFVFYEYRKIFGILLLFFNKSFIYKIINLTRSANGSLLRLCLIDILVGFFTFITIHTTIVHYSVILKVYCDFYNAQNKQDAIYSFLILSYFSLTLFIIWSFYIGINVIFLKILSSSFK